MHSFHQNLTISGIVYSEMKGYWSTPDVLLSNLGTRGLCPDTPLGRDSGGNPEQIPELTYEQFKSFYERYYHPSNARIFFYGDDDPEARLRLLDEYLRDYDALAVESDRRTARPMSAAIKRPRKR